VTNLIHDDAEAQLALFLSKTLTNAIMMYRQGGPGPIGPPSSKPGPIGPPRGKGGGGRGVRGPDINEFYADPSLSGGRGGGGLYGLTEPLLQYSSGHGAHVESRGHMDRAEMSRNLLETSGSLEPPYKRKYENWS